MESILNSVSDNNFEEFASIICCYFCQSWCSSALAATVSLALGGLGRRVARSQSFREKEIVVGCSRPLSLSPLSLSERACVVMLGAADARGGAATSGATSASWYTHSGL